MSKTKVHTRYYNQAGTLVPGVTTALGVMGKPALIHWAWKLGIEGKDYKKVRDNAADIGTLAHYLIECYLKNETPNTDEYSKNDIDKAENAYLAFLDWWKPLNLTVIDSEKQIVSEDHNYGGTIDLIARNGDDLWLIDFKSSKGIYDEHKYQLAAYHRLLMELYGENAVSHIIQIGKEDGAFAHYQFTDLDKEWEIFLACLGLYKALRSKK